MSAQPRSSVRRRAVRAPFATDITKLAAMAAFFLDRSQSRDSLEAAIAGLDGAVASSFSADFNDPVGALLRTQMGERRPFDNLAWFDAERGAIVPHPAAVRALSNALKSIIRLQDEYGAALTALRKSAASLPEK